jgi:hypothetical protein
MKFTIAAAIIIFLNPLNLLRAQDFIVESTNIQLRKSGQNVMVGISANYGPAAFNPPSVKIESVTHPPVPDSSGQFEFYAWLDYSGASVGEGKPSGTREFDLGSLPDGTYGINLTAFFGFLPEENNSHAELIINSSADDFSTWIGGSGVPQSQQNATDDADGDGVPNLVEYLFGTNPSSISSKPSLIPGVFSISGFDLGTVTLPNLSTDVTDVSMIVEYSRDLKQWSSSGIEKDPQLGNTRYIAPATSPVFFRVRAIAL